MSEFIIAGGAFMWPLLACSVLIISISIERLWFLQLRLVSPHGLKNQIINLYNKNLLNQRQSEEISQLSSLGYLLINCIKYKDLQRENLESKIEEKASEVKHLLDRNLTMSCFRGAFSFNDINDTSINRYLHFLIVFNPPFIISNSDP